MTKKTPAFDGVNVQPAPTDRINVSAEDYKRASPGDQYRCAIVWAIRRKYPNALRIRANTGEISFSVGEWRLHYPTDQETVNSVIRPLDTGGELKPATVRLHDGYATPVKYLDEDQLAAARTRMAESVAAKTRRAAGSNESAKSDFRRFK